MVVPPEGQPLKLDYKFPARSGIATWRNQAGDLFVDVEIEFERSLSIEERWQVIQHFVLGFHSLNAQFEYLLTALEFYNSNALLLTFQVLEVSITRSLLALLVELRSKLPVVRIGNRSYSRNES